MNIKEIKELVDQDPFFVIHGYVGHAGNVVTKVEDCIKAVYGYQSKDEPYIQKVFDLIAEKLVKKEILEFEVLTATVKVGFDFYIIVSNAYVHNDRVMYRIEDISIEQFLF